MSTLRDRIIKLAYDRPDLRDDLLPLVKQAAPSDFFQNMIDQSMEPPTEKELRVQAEHIKNEAYGFAAHDLKSLTGHTSVSQMQKVLDIKESRPGNKFQEGDTLVWSKELLSRKTRSRLKELDGLDSSDPVRLVIEGHYGDMGRVFDRMYLVTAGNSKTRIRMDNRTKKFSGKVFELAYKTVSNLQS